jgi:hypothetical protein
MPISLSPRAPNITFVAGTCERCGGQARLRRYCGPCRTKLEELERQYVQKATAILSASGPLGQDWEKLGGWCAKVGLPPEDAQRAVKGIANGWLSRFAASTAAGVVAKTDLAEFRRAAAILNAEVSFTQPLDVYLERKYRMDRVRYYGEMPRASSNGLHLPTDELCYLNVSATRTRQLKASTQLSKGQLIVTNRKIRFVSTEHGGEVPLSKVMSVLAINVLDFTLEATSRSLSGNYRVTDAEWAAAVIDGTLKLDRRVLLAGGGGLRSIPQHVKSAVWQRDGGRCVQCAANTYLEYDHIIPRSKGGADSEGNLQLLCRRCNLQKSDRI